MSTINDYLGFNPHETESVENFEGRQPALPEGEYTAVASDAKRKHNKAGDGWYWEIVFTIIQGEYEGRSVTHYFNIETRNEIATRIGRGQMKRFLEAVGNLEPKNEDDFLNIAVRIYVKCEKSTYTRNGQSVEGINNKITKIEPDFVEPASQNTSESGTPEKAPWRKQTA